MGKVANGITTVHLTYVREQTGHALIDAREWTPAARNVDPVTSAVMGLASEVYGACTELREYLEDHDQAYVLRVRSAFRLVPGGGGTLTCKAGRPRGWAGATSKSAPPGPDPKGHRWYAAAVLVTLDEHGELCYECLISEHDLPGG